MIIPGAPLANSRLPIDDTLAPTQPVRVVQALTDILSDVAPGQRMVATIQSQLPNGTYRAMIAQREITLALPFSAKAGDSLELEVVDTDGRLTFAVSAPRGEGGAAKESVTTTLSQTGQLIGKLLAGKDDAGAPPAQLNGGKPIATSAPQSGAEIRPSLQKALSESGMFYESHQQSWLEGRLSRETLLAEPQGRMPAAPPPPTASFAQSTATPAAQPAGTNSVQPPELHAAATNVAAPHETPPPLPTDQSTVGTSQFQPAGQPGSASIEAGTRPATSHQASAFAPEIAPIVQQQLTALGTNVYAWQGQAWPGQTIEWEIVDADGNPRPRGAPDEHEPPWQTRLHLAMPSLGALDATLRLRGKEIEIDLTARSDDARRLLAAGGDGLRRQFEAVGLKLAALGVGQEDNDGG